MYLGKRKIFNLAKYEEERSKCIEYKSDAVDTAFSELEGLVDTGQLAMQYFAQSKEWMDARIHGCMVLKKTEAFQGEEYHQLAEAFRHIAKRLEAHADEIDAAKDE